MCVLNFSRNTHSSYGLARTFLTRGKRSTQQPMLILVESSSMLSAELNWIYFSESCVSVSLAKHNAYLLVIRGRKSTNTPVSWILSKSSDVTFENLSSTHHKTCLQAANTTYLRKYVSSSPTFLCHSVRATLSLRFLPKSTSVIVI